MSTLVHSMNPRNNRAGQGGFSLVEILVSLVIGFVVIGAVFTNYLSTGVSGRNSSAVAQVTEDASVALNILRSYVAPAGYARPYGMTANGFQRTYSGQAIFGCDNTFTTPGAATIETLACTAGAGNDSIAIVYEADSTNSNSTAAGLLADCVGAGITQTAAAGAVPAYTLAQARFYLSANNELMCRGNGGTAGAGGMPGTPEPLVENVRQLVIQYGLSGNETVGGVTRPAQPVRVYATAADVTTLNRWNNVRAVRICVVVASVVDAFDSPTRYRDCAGTSTLPTDRRLYRAFTTTVMVQNRLGG